MITHIETAVDRLNRAARRLGRALSSYDCARMIRYFVDREFDKVINPDSYGGLYPMSDELYWQLVQNEFRHSLCEAVLSPIQPSRGWDRLSDAAQG
jgi:hypothetical protein